VAHETIATSGLPRSYPQVLLVSPLVALVARPLVPLYWTVAGCPVIGRPLVAPFLDGHWLPCSWTATGCPLLDGHWLRYYWTATCYPRLKTSIIRQPRKSPAAFTKFGSTTRGGRGGGGTPDLAAAKPVVSPRRFGLGSVAASSRLKVAIIWGLKARYQI
jgi:hypothetical protein